MKPTNPNPAGKHGKPFSLAPYSLEDALQKILKATPEPKVERKPAKRPANKKRASKSSWISYLTRGGFEFFQKRGVPNPPI
jgi:hypothetical protein